MSSPPTQEAPNPVHKARPGRVARLLRLIGSMFDPRAYLHAIRLINYYNYSHVQPRRKMQVGPGAKISPNAVFSNPERIEIGAAVSVGARVFIWAGPSQGRIVIGDHTLIAPHVMITAANYRFNDGTPIDAQPMAETDVIIGKDVWLGFGAVILPGANIGDGAVIGAGAVVRGTIAPYAVVAPTTALSVGQRINRTNGAISPGAMPGQAPEDVAGVAAVLTLIQSEFPALTADEIPAPIETTRLDSFDLITLRSALETRLDTRISDADWGGAASLADLARLPVLTRAVATTPDLPPEAPDMGQPPPRAAGDAPDLPPDPAGDDSPIRVRVTPNGQAHRSRPLEMPQMALTGLSESWLFKELGDMHWAMICAFLRRPSATISDETGARLYATFTRIRLEVPSTLRGFAENTPLAIDSHLNRHGGSFFFGTHEVTGAEGLARAHTMSTFAKYGERGNNTSLMKGTPVLPDPQAVPPLDAFPDFGVQYRDQRANPPAGARFECEYEILPTHDINGVGLLYFAAYPTIVDLCLEQAEGKGFLMGHSTIAKDVFYFANSEPDETLLFRIHDRVEEADGTLEHRVTLSRKSDDVRMAEVISRKRPSTPPLAD